MARYFSESKFKLEKISTIIIKLRTLERSASLRKQTQLRPVLRNKTRRSTTFETISRYGKLKSFIPRDDLELMPFILDETEEAVITSSHSRLTEIETVTKTLQQERGVSLSDMRALYDALIVKFPSMEQYLSQNADIVHSKDIENGMVKIIDGKASD